MQLLFDYEQYSISLFWYNAFEKLRTHTEEEYEGEAGIKKKYNLLYFTKKEKKL